MNTWFLVWLIATGHDPLLVRIPMSSQTACDTARQGVKFPPAAASYNQGAHVVVGSALAVWCAAGDQQVVIELRPPAPPEPTPVEVVTP